MIIPGSHSLEPLTQKKIKILRKYIKNNKKKIIRRIIHREIKELRIVRVITIKPRNKKAIINTPSGGIGIATSKKKALGIAIGEALERYSFTLGYMPFIKKYYDELPRELKPKKKELLYLDKRYAWIKNKKIRIIDPLEERIEWVLVRSKDRELLLPYQFFYGNYMRYMIKEPSSTGVALGNKQEAINKAIYEAAERDTLVRWFYRDKKVRSRTITLNDLPKTSLAKKIIKHFDRYKFHAFLLKRKVTTLLLIAERKNTFFIGSASSPTLREMTEKALKEVLITKIFLPLLKPKIYTDNIEKIKYLPQHALYYFNEKRKKELMDYLYSITKEKEITLDNPRNIEGLFREVFYKDITAPALRIKDLYVVKVFIPGFLDIIKNPALRWYNYYETKKLAMPELLMPFA